MDATGWDWFQVRTFLEQRAPDHGIAVVCKKIDPPKKKKDTTRESKTTATLI